MKWKEEEYSGDGKKPEFKKAGDKVDGKVDLTEALIDDTQTAYVISSVQIPKYIGGYHITGGNGTQDRIVFNFVKKPNWFRRTCAKFFLGWTWVDEKEEKEKKGLLLG